MSIRHVLVPLDGTPFAEQALPTAVDLARRAGGALVLFHVDVPEPPPTSEAAALLASAAPTTTAASDARYLDAVAARLGGGATPLAVRTLHREGATGDAVREACAREEIDLVVLASHTRGALGQLVRGSVARSLVDDAPRVPLLVLRGHHENADTSVWSPDGTTIAPAHPIDCVLAWIDDDTPVTVIASAAADLAMLTGAALTLVSVQPPARGALARLIPAFMPTEPEAGRAVDSAGAQQAAERDAAALLDEIAHRLASHGLRVDTRVVEDDDVVAGVARCAEDVRADVVVVGRREHVDTIRRALPVSVLFAAATSR